MIIDLFVILKFIVIGSIGAYGTCVLSPHPHIGKIRAAMGLNLILGCVLFFYEIPDEKIIASLFLGSTFVGMSDPKALNKKDLILALILYELLYFYFFQHLRFLGGALGSLAFMASGLSPKIKNYFFKKSGLT